MDLIQHNYFENGHTRCQLILVFFLLWQPYVCLGLLFSMSPLVPIIASTVQFLIYNFLRSASFQLLAWGFSFCPTKDFLFFLFIFLYTGHMFCPLNYQTLYKLWHKWLFINCVEIMVTPLAFFIYSSKNPHQNLSFFQTSYCSHPFWTFPGL